MNDQGAGIRPEGVTGMHFTDEANRYNAAFNQATSEGLLCGTEQHEARIAELMLHAMPVMGNA